MPARAPQHALALPPQLDVNALRPLLDDLLARRGGPLTLDGSAVTRVGGLGLQLLMSARATWLADGQSLTIADPSPALADACTLAGAAILQG